MKKFFFTLLAILMLVTVRAVAETVPVEISKKVGAMTFCCDKDLDFSDFNKNGKYDLRPYYVSGYSAGNFVLKAFDQYKVPANTPMILLGQQYDDGNNEGKIPFEVPVYNGGDLDLKAYHKDGVWRNEDCFLVPILPYTYKKWVVDEETGVSSRFTFFNFTSDDTEDGYNGASGYNATKTVSIAYGTQDEKRYLNRYTDYATATSHIGTTYHEGDSCIILNSGTNGLYVVVWEDEDEFFYWEYQGVALTKAKNKDAIGWFVTKQVPGNRPYTQYILTANGKNPVFKYLSTTGRTIPQGSCIVRLYTETPASAREEMSFEFEDEESSMVDDGDVTGIKDVKIVQTQKGIYNINGQKFAKLQKGLNIVNGKKVVVK